MWRLLETNGAKRFAASIAERFRDTTVKAFLPFRTFESSSIPPIGWILSAQTSTMTTRTYASRDRV
jgi:hypothetical protein